MPASTIEYLVSGTWTPETNFIRLTLIDEIFAPMAAEITVANQDGANSYNTRETVYTNYQEIRITEGNTSRVIFHGRIERIKPQYDAGYGQVVHIYARDNLQELLKRTNRTEYNSTTTRSSQISSIISDHIFNSASIDTSDTDKFELSSDTVTAGQLDQDFDRQNKSALRTIGELANSDEDSASSGWIFYLDTTFSGDTAAPDLHYFARGTRPQGGPNTNGLHIEFKGTEADAASPTRYGVRSILPDYNFPREPRELVTRTRVIYTDSAGEKQEVHGILVNHDTPSPGSFVPGNAITWAGGGAGRIEYSNNSFTVIGPTNGDLTNTNYLTTVSNTVLTSTVGATDYTANVNLVTDTLATTEKAPGSLREAIGQDIEIVERRYENENITGAREIAKQTLYQGGETVQRGNFRIIRYPYVRFTGTHTGSSGSVSLTDSSGDFVNSGIFAGDVVHNTTDNSSATISSRIATIISGTLTGGTDNDWDFDDEYRIDVLVRAGQDVRLVSIPGVTNQDAIITKITYLEGPGMQESHIDVLFHDTGRGFTLPRDIFSSIINKLEASESRGDTTDLTTDAAFKKLLGRPKEYTDTGYPANHPGFGQPINVRTSHGWFWRDNFGEWVKDSVANGGLGWAGHIGLNEAKIYWNISDAQIQAIAAGNKAGLNITDVFYVEGGGALFGREQILYGAFLARMNIGSYADDRASNATPCLGHTNGQQNLAAARFNGSTQYFSHADHADLDLDTGDFSIELTANPRAVGPLTLISKYQNASNFYELTMNASEQLTFVSDKEGVNKITIATNVTLWENRDYHIVVVVDRDSAANTEIYLDGTVVTSGTPTVSADTIANTGAFEIGRKGSANQHWSGRIRHVRLYKGVLLTSAQITTLYNTNDSLIEGGSYAYAALPASITAPTVAWDLSQQTDPDTGDFTSTGAESVGSLDLTNNGTITSGGTNDQGTPAVGDALAEVDDPSLFMPMDYFGIETKRWAAFNDGLNAVEVMQVENAGAKAVGTITLTGQPLDGETVTVGDRVYTFEATAADIDTDGEVFIGADFVVTTRNLYNAIIAGPQSGTAYQVASANPVCTASFSKNGIITLTAKWPGTRGNSITLSESATNLTVSVFSGGDDNLDLTVPYSRDLLYFDSGGLPAARTTRDTGTTTTGSRSPLCTDSGASFISAGVVAGDIIHNTTDGSVGKVFAVTATTVTATMYGGTNNWWTSGDSYEIYSYETVTIDGLIYYWASGAGQLDFPYTVLIGANVTACRDNLKKAINVSGTEGTDYGSDTLAHPTCRAIDGADDGTHRTLHVESLLAGTVDIAVSEATTSTSWLDRASNGKLHKLKLWGNAASSNIDVWDYIWKSFGFGNAADPNCCVMQIKDGKFEALLRSQGHETRRILDDTYDRYLNDSLNPSGTRNWVVLWHSDTAIFYITDEFEDADPTLLYATQDNIPYWPLEMDAISYVKLNSTMNIPWVEYYAVPDDYKKMGKSVFTNTVVDNYKGDNNSFIVDLKVVKLYTVPSNQILLLSSLIYTTMDGQSGEDTHFLIKYNNQNFDVISGLTSSSSGKANMQVFPFDRSYLVLPGQSISVTLDAGTSVLASFSATLQGVLL
jgi:hypothetical protein